MRLALTLALLALGSAAAAAPDYVGSAACADCHEDAAEAWTGSDHALAWTLPSEGTVLGDFDDASFEHHGVVTRFTRRGDAFVIETEDGDGARRSFDVVGVAGIRPLQQYLLQTEPGRTQAFDIAWDTINRRWYPLYPDQMLQPRDGLHWTGPYKSWEARCAECHATGYRRNYDGTRRYAPEMAEIGVGCEACHGPGAEHVAWAAGAEPLPGLTPRGLTVDLSSAEAQIQQCAGCHARREDFFDGNPVPGTPFHDSYNLALLRDGLYHPDGSIQAEDYEYGSFLQSRMYARGVRCSDCHEPHSAKLRAEGNAVCAQCHSPAGNPRFPSLRLAVYDGPAHHFHAPGTPGAQCRSCHMIERTYMGVDARRDHSFRVPRPDLSVTTGAPNACTDCHRDRDAAWAAAELERRFPDSARRGPHFATVFAQARWDAAQRAPELLGLATDPQAAGIVRASALDLLAPVADAGIADRAAALLADPDPLVRAAAAGAQRGTPPEARLERLLPALEDPVRAVRLSAARAMLGAPGDAPALRAAMAEWQAALAARADFPETHLQIGGAALTARNFELARAAFAEAVAMDPQLVDGWTMVVRIAAATGDTGGARAALAAALAANPGDPTLGALQSELGAP
jgi:predicted CXXCH cytochrome family protein